MENILEQLMEVGNELAFARKGVCYELQLSNDIKVVTFYCTESSGEKYTIEMGYREIESIWGIKGREIFYAGKATQKINDSSKQND